MRNKPEVYAGIDVSKNTLDVCILKDTTPTFLSVSNDKTGIQALIRKLRKENLKVIVIEPSGGYEKQVVYALLQESMSVALVNPRKIRQFARALSIAAKTDRIDARVLAEFGKRLNPEIFKLHSKEQEELKELFRRREQVVRMISDEKKRYKQISNSLLKKKIKEHIKYLEEEKKQLEKEIENIIRSKEELKGISEIIKSIKGFGVVTAFCLLSELPELGNIDDRKLCALVGVAPFNNDSGNKKGKRQIWGGRSIIREKLFMAMKCAVKHNGYFKHLFNSLIARGKPFKVAIIACIRKLLVILNTLVGKGVMWDESIALRNAGVDI